MKKWQANLMLLSAAMFWGIGFVATDVSIKYLTVGQMQTIRFGLATIILCIVFHKRLLKTNKKTIISGFIIGLAFFFAMTTQNFGLQQTTVPKNAFITVTNVIWVPLAGWLLFKKKPAHYIWYGIAVMLIGFVFLIFEVDIFNLSASLANLKSQLNLTFGDFLTLICAFGFAAQYILQDLFVQDQDPVALLTFELMISAILSLIMSLMVDGNPMAIPVENLKMAMPPIMFSVIFPTICSFGFILIAQQYVSASNTAIICSTESLFATFFAIILGNTPYSSGLLVGGVIITIGIIWAETGLKFNKEEKEQLEVDDAI